MNIDDKPRLLYDLDNVQRTYNLTTILQIPDNQGYVNFFRMFLAATTKQTIEEFIDYQESMDSLGIQISLEQLDTGSEDEADRVFKKGDDVPWLQPEDDEHMSIDNGKLKIGISRLYISTPRPHKIIYKIDPIVSGSVQRRASITAGFNMSRTSGVRCDVDPGGRVDTYLQEMSSYGSYVTRQSQIDVTQSYSFADQNAESTGAWKVLAIGKEVESTVTISYARLVW